MAERGTQDVTPTRRHAQVLKPRTSQEKAKRKSKPRCETSCRTFQAPDLYPPRAVIASAAPASALPGDPAAADPAKHSARPGLEVRAAENYYSLDDKGDLERRWCACVPSTRIRHRTRCSLAAAIVYVSKETAAVTRQKKQRRNTTGVSRLGLSGTDM